SNLSKTLEVTLASYRSDKAPEEADFLAQENQEGSGTEEEARMLTTDVEAPFQSNDITPASVQKQEVSAPKALANTPARITTTAASPNQAVSSPDKQPPVEAKPVPEGPPKMLLQRSLEMASLE
ncbi:hypothetical protein Q4595_21360, partial [Wenyingzhuangia sp. 1_MG-2023]|nr:hypothetical protein [Wenyingzhuangia sp. 1_MG-2023]